ncbi:hypothetical protein [Bordetella genomosp. 9]|uniref:Uncharacterized protein n=1 Tax=Bordetella genomosp. 9 TaxID=1416803 RepID=A0A1W6YVV0_9BORD|nr:hypothetical protein [Bordetella genomosp. 9]ARP85196.1 hypothetical protein CAL13_02405 [Bordetella genomosp. 9]
MRTDLTRLFGLSARAPTPGAVCEHVKTLPGSASGSIARLARSALPVFCGENGLGSALAAARVQGFPLTVFCLGPNESRTANLRQRLFGSPYGGTSVQDGGKPPVVTLRMVPPSAAIAAATAAAICTIAG